MRLPAVFAITAAAALAGIAGCQSVSGLSDLEKDPTFDPDAAQADGTPSDTSITPDDTAIVDDSAATDDTTATTDSTATPTDTAKADTAKADSAKADAAVADTAVADAGECRATYMGHCYFETTAAVTWDAAKTACEARGAYLAELTDAAEVTAVLGAVTGQRWLGLEAAAGDAMTTAADFKWLRAGTAAFAEGWAATEPTGDGHHARLNGGLFYDAPDGPASVYGALCERDSL